MTEVLQNGTWRLRPLSITGGRYLEFVLSAQPHVVATVGIRGLEALTKSRSGATALPLSTVAPGEYPVFAQVGASKLSFSQDEKVSLSIGVGGTGQYLITDIPVGGRSKVDLLVLTIGQDGTVAVQPVPDAPESTGLGGWIANRLSEQGYDTRVTVSSFHVDTSASMRRYAAQVNELKQFVSSYCRATQSEEPRWEGIPIGNVPEGGVGAVPEVTNGSGRAVVVTDIPPYHVTVDCLVFGDPMVTWYLSNGSPNVFHFDGLPLGGTDELSLETDPQLVERLTEFAAWMCSPMPTTER